MPRARTVAVLVALAALPAMGQPPAAPNPQPALPIPTGRSDRGGRPSRPAAPPPAAARKPDRHGDLLPAGAVARFGSVRLRHGGALTALGFMPDGKHFLSTSATEDGFRVWEAATGKEAARLNVPVAAAAVAPDRTVLFAFEGQARVWAPFDGGRVRTLPPHTLPPEGASALAVHPGGKVFAAAVPAGVVLIDLATGDRTAELKVPGDQPPQRIVFSPDGRWVAAAGPRTGVWLWNLATRRRVRTYPAPGDHVDFSFSPDGSRLAIAGGPVALFHTDSEEPVEGFHAPEAPVFAARFTADGKSILAAQEDGSVSRLDAATGQEKEGWSAPNGVAAEPPLAIAADGAWVAAMDDTGGIRVWNPRDGTGPAVERRSPLCDPGYSADGKVASALSAEGSVVTFDPATGAPGASFETGFETNHLVVWDARSGLAAGLGKVGDEPELHVRDVVKRKVVARFVLAAGEAPGVTFSPTDATQLGIFGTATTGLYSTRTGAVVRSFAVGRHDGPRHWGDLSADGRLVAVATTPVTVWEVATGRKRFELPDPAIPQDVTFSADGRWLAAYSLDEVVLFDLRTGTTARRLLSSTPDGEAAFVCAAFSPDGSRLATGGVNGVVTLWDVATGEALVAFDRHEGNVTGVRFSADGSRLLSASVDGTALVWDATARPAQAAAVAGADEAFGLLASPDPAAAHRGIAYLQRTPDAAVKLLGERVAVPTAVQAGRVSRLVADLGHAEFPTRQAAVRELGDIGAEAGPALRAVADAPPSAEVRRLAGDLLDRLAAPPTRPDDLRAIRAAEVLETIGTPAARDVLARWAAGPANHRLTTEAAAALARLTPRR
ncbi:MAG TPA: PQQ-binding-like beta-propeller repeat protein [Urbifossiella sp.]|nr:PQQ-binding-like beta-propeller repeat protein [Urbifossiella sp.]